MPTPTEALERIEECRKTKDTKLDLSYLQLTKIPDEIVDFIWLKVLRLSGNLITKIEGLGSLINLSELDLSENKITKIEGLYRVMNLSQLLLAGNEINKIEGLSRLVNLSQLSLSGNRIIKIEGLDKLVNLSQLDFSGNRITKIEGLDTLVNLSQLYLYSNQITKIEGLYRLVNLLQLHLYYNQITKIEGLYRLVNLLQLYLYSNQIIKIESLNRLANLSILSLTDNKITKIEDLDKLINLSQLYISGNEITKIEGLDKLVNLSQLSLSGNKITKIEGLDKLVNLSQLSLSDNEILKIEGLDTLVNLSGLRIEGNPLEKEYNLVLKDDLSHWGIIKNIIDRNTEEGIEITIVLPAKILLLGNHASGKSSLLHYLQNQNLEYKGYSTHLLKIEIYHSKIKEGNPDAIFYDFGGQDYYHGIYRAFLSSGSGYLLLWNKNQNDNKILLKDSKGFATQNFKVNYWLGQKKHLEFSKYNNVTDPLLLIQTYGKANESPLFIADYQDKAIQNTFYISLSEQYNPDKNKAALDYLKAEIDALINDKKRQRLEKEWYVKFYQHIIDEQTVQAETVENLLVYYQPTNKKDNEEIVNSLRAELQQFHNQGLVLFYPEIDESLVWLNPAGLVQYIHTNILKESLISQYQGRVPVSHFDGKDAKIIALLEKQKVIFKHYFSENKVEEFIIPNFLPLVKSNETEYDLFTFGLSNLLFILKYMQFLPIGLINQLICFFGRQPDRKKFWRDQLLFTFEQKCKVLIRLDFELLEITILVSFKEEIHVQEQEQIGKYLFYCIMSMYWDIEPILYNAFIRERSNFQLTDNVQNDSTSTSIKIDIEQDFNRFFNDSYQYIFDDKAYRPTDLYVSRDNKYFVKYDELGKHDTKETRIISHQLNADRTQFEKTTEIPVKPFEMFTNKKMTAMKKVFISYSKNDLAMVNRFRDALVPLHDDGIIENPWYCTFLEAGSKWDEEIQQKLSDSDIVFFMCSMSFIRTEYIRKHEIKKAIDLNKTIIPIVLNFCEWDSYLGDYTALPYIAKPVADFNNQDLAWLLVIKGIRISLEQSDQKELSKQVKELYERLVEGKLDNNK